MGGADSRQEDDPDTLLITSSFLLADAQSAERVFELLNDEGAFPRLVSLITEPALDNVDSVRRLIMQMLYEMSRIQKISADDLGMPFQDQRRQAIDKPSQHAFPTNSWHHCLT
jgi:hypothetical protein